ncbi:MAG: AMP-binding protein, partial [Syntrophobacterales bacterium]
MRVSTIPLIARAEERGERIAVIGQETLFTYRQLLDISKHVALSLLGDKKDLGEERVAFLAPRGFVYAAMQWGVWRAGGIAVPLCEIYPPAELEYVIRDAKASIVVAHPEFESRLQHVT